MDIDLCQAVGLAISNREQAKMKKMLYDAQVLANKVPNDRQDLGTHNRVQWCRNVKTFCRLYGPFFGLPKVESILLSPLDPLVKWKCGKLSLQNWNVFGVSCNVVRSVS